MKKRPRPVGWGRFFPLGGTELLEVLRPVDTVSTLPMGVPGSSRALARP
jgi:hypothetical protein